MKADEGAPDMEKPEKVVGSDVESGRFDDAGLSRELEEAASGDDIIELVDVIEEGSIPESAVTLLAEEEAGEEGREIRIEAEALPGEERPVPEAEAKLPPDFLMEEEKDREPAEDMPFSVEPGSEEEAYGVTDTLEPPARFAIGAETRMGEEAGLSGEVTGREAELAEELEFAFDEMETEIGGPSAGAAGGRGVEDFVIYDENSNAIGEVLADEQQDNFEQELDSMLQSLELPDEKGPGLPFLESEASSFPDERPFDELISPGIAGGGPRTSAVYGEPPEGREEIVIGGTEVPLGISEEQLEALVTRVAEKVAERISRKTLSEVAERVITEAIAALRKSMEA